MSEFNLRQRVRDMSKPPLVIQPVTLNDPGIVEIAGFAGCDAVMIDCEHGMINTETVRSMMAHGKAAGMPTVFRPTFFKTELCRQALDQGAAGVHVAHIDTAEEAQAVVDACRYAPLGKREMSLGRAIDYDIGKLGKHVAESNEQLLLVIMIESVEAMANIESIAAVKGIDVMHMGTADLTHSMGLVVGKGPYAQVDEAIEKVIAAGKKHGVAVGIPEEDPEEVAKWTAKGIRYFEADTPDYTLRGLWAARKAKLDGIFGV